MYGFSSTVVCLSHAPRNFVHAVSTKQASPRGTKSLTVCEALRRYHRDESTVPVRWAGLEVGISVATQVLRQL
jgi:hypothetical protein